MCDEGCKFSALLLSAPVVSHCDVVNGAASGGQSVTISGVNFGESDVTPTAVVILTLCKTSAWSSTTGLVCDVAAGSGVGSLWGVCVTAASLVGTDTAVFTFDGCALHCLW